MKLNDTQSYYLDFLRLISAQFVVIGHGLVMFGIVPIGSHNYIQQTPVVIFFILSGFLIAYALFNKEESYNFKVFFIERFSRIYSGLIPCLIFILLIDLLRIHVLHLEYPYANYFDVKSFLANLFMLENYPKTHFQAFGSGRPLWSLAIEWWMYMFFGMLYLSYYKNKISWKGACLLMFFAIVPFYNLYSSYSNSGKDSFTIIWFAGWIIAFFYSYLLKTERISILASSIFLVLFLIAAIRRYSMVPYVYDTTFVLLVSFAFMFSLLFLSNYQINKPLLGSKKVIFCAGYSYTLYLIHYTILDLISVLFKLGSIEMRWLVFIGAFLVSNLLSAFIAYHTEMKYKNLGRWIKRKLGVIA
ncbi:MULTISPECIES: acyltransferase family protein [Cysteiniphilum]|uniref:acyltransferase family protein n=1 Tax=Cysteiniphilum TaxID=2056696 RepID=UPI000E344C51|nr:MULTISPECIES: acyltransferase [Cysteiniphilum]